MYYLKNSSLIVGGKEKFLWNAFVKIVLIVLLCSQSLREGSSTRQIV